MGGYSLFCSYFNGEYYLCMKSTVRQGDEIRNKSFDRWYHKFSGATIAYVDSYDAILQAVDTRVLVEKLNRSYLMTKFGLVCTMDL